MTRKTNVNGMKAIIKHNVMKQLSKMQLSKKEYSKFLKLANNFIDSASIDDLKQKGITKFIITEISPKPTMIGEGKRKRDEDEGKRKLFQNVDPRNIQQLTVDKETSKSVEPLEEPTQTQPKPKPRSWLNRLFFRRPEEKISKPAPKFKTSWFEPYVTGRPLPSSTELPRTQHHSRADAEISAERHRTNEHRNTLNEITKDISRRQQKQETMFMHENEERRRKALEHEALLSLEGKLKLGPGRMAPKQTTEPNQNPLSDIARRRQEIAQRHSS